MAYSTIKHKPCKCGCGRFPTMGFGGYNSGCRPDLLAQKRAKIQSRQAEKEKEYRKTNGNGANFNSNHVGKGNTLPKFEGNHEPKNNHKSDLEKWFDYVATVIRAKPYCQNCGEFIPPQYYRHASAHILPKKIFPSISTNPLNFIILAANCGCHQEYDRSVEDAAKMPIFKLAVQRFRQFEHLITEKHKQLDLFKDKANSF